MNDQNGDALPGVTVTFAITALDGSLSPTSVATKASGQAETVWTLGATAGINRLSATAAGVTQIRNFRATGTAVTLVATSLVEVSGDDQSALVSTELSDPFVVQVNDQNGGAFSGAVVTFAVTGGGGTLSETSVTTGADGRAESTLTLGSTAGSNTVTADVSGISTTITFNATATETVEDLVATSIVRVSGNNQTGTVSTDLSDPFVVEVRDQNGDGSIRCNGCLQLLPRVVVPYHQPLSQQVQMDAPSLRLHSVQPLGQTPSQLRCVRYLHDYHL